MGSIAHIAGRLTRREWGGGGPTNSLAQELFLMFRDWSQNGIDGPLIINQVGNNPALVINRSPDTSPDAPAIGLQTPGGTLPPIVLGSTTIGGFTPGNISVSPGGVAFGGIDVGGFNGGTIDYTPGNINIGVNGGPGGTGTGPAVPAPGTTPPSGGSGGGGGGLVGRVLGGSGSSYTLAVYDETGTSANQSAAPLNVAAGETVPVGTWVPVFLLGSSYTFLATVFAAEAP